MQFNSIPYMLHSLHIKNFKSLKDFNVQSLNKVNLLVGMNNVGKSSILEAIDLYSSRFDLVHIIQMLSLRKEDMSAFAANPDITSEDEISAILPFVTEGSLRLFVEEGISVGELGDELTAKLSRVFRKATDNGVELQRASYDAEIPDSTVALVVENRDGKFMGMVASLDGGGLKSSFKKSDLPVYPVKLLPSRENPNEKEMLTEAWAGIAMSDLEPHVVKALQIINPDITRFNIIGKDSVPCVSLLDAQGPVRLNSMGDGLNKILRIILAMLSCKDGILLIDEIENGLHYSVTDQLWELIFKVANQLNVQVIATTHSSDCVMSFIKSCDEGGQLIRVEADNSGLKSVQYEQDEMKYIYSKMAESKKHYLDIR